MTRTLFLSLFLALAAASCDGDSPSDGVAPDIAWGATNHGIRCSISLPAASYATGAKVPVAIRIENVSDGPVSLTTLPYFSLADSVPRYLALTDIIGKNPEFGHNSRFALSLPKGGTLTSEIDISALYWAPLVQSSISTKRLYEVVPPGTCTLRLEIEIVSESGETAIKSNTIPLGIVR